MKTENQHIGDDQFDQLLMLSLLGKEELFNELNTETMSTHVFTTSANGYSTLENESILSKLQNDFGGSKRNFRFNLWMLIPLLLVASILAFWHFNSGKNSEVAASTVVISQQTEPIIVASAEPNEIREVKREPTTKIIPFTMDTAEVPEEIIIEEQPKPFFNFGHTRYYIPEDNY